MIVLLKETHYTPNPYRGRLLFYFTDNMVTYNILRKRRSKSPRLHTLIMKITSLEISLNCCILCVHVPRDVMITNEMDSLSPGTELTQLILPPKDLYKQLFTSTPSCHNFQLWAQSKIQPSNLTSTLSMVTDNDNWEGLVRHTHRLM